KKQSLNGLFFHEHENKKASNGPVDHFFMSSKLRKRIKPLTVLFSLRPRNWKGATAKVGHFFLSLKF
ncbi:TPA: hypothetical protein ACGO0K_001250, partial [Streptococcus suis]